MNLDIAAIQSKSGLESVLSTLAFALPPTSLIHVGIGDGIGATCVWMDWGINDVVVVEADSSRLQKATELLGKKGYGIQFGKAERVFRHVEGVVGTRAGEVGFYKASHPRESGLLSPESLRRYWPSLTACSVEVLEAITVDDIWQDQKLSHLQRQGRDSLAAVRSGAETYAEVDAGLDVSVDTEVDPYVNIDSDNDAIGGAASQRDVSKVQASDLTSNRSLSSLVWLIVDCLPAAVILEGAGKTLEDSAIVCVRAIRDVSGARLQSLQSVTSQALSAQSESLHLASSLVNDCGVDHLDAYFRDLEFRRVAFVADGHPDVGYAVYCRDGVALAEKRSQPLKERIGQQEILLEETLTKYKALAAQHDALVEEKISLTKLSDDLTKEKGELQQRQDELQSELTNVSDQLTKEMQDKVRAIAKVSESFEAVSAEKNSLLQQKSALEQVAASQKQQLEALSQKLTEAENQLVAILQERDALAKRRQELNLQTVSLKEQLEKSQQAQQGLVRQREEADAKLKGLEEQLAVVAKEMEAVSAKVDSLGNENATLLVERDALIDQRDVLTKEKEAIAKDREALVAEKTALVAENEKLSGEKSGVAGQLDEQKKAVVERQAKINELTKLLQTEMQKVKDLTSKVHAVNAEKSDLVQQKQSLEKSLKDKDGLIAEKTKAHVEAQTNLETLCQEVERLKVDLVAAQNTALAAGSLEKRLEQLFSEQMSYIQQTTNALGQHVTRMSQQQRDQSALSYYMQSGQWLVDTSLSPTYAKALVQLRESRQYDAMVVFGSSATVEFLSQVVMAPRPDLPRLRNDRSIGQELSETVSRVSDRDLPQSILALEHQKEQCDVLVQKLKSKGLDQCAEVLHSPWIEVSFQGKTALFYAAERPLHRLYQWLKDDARVLVVLGDTLPDGGHSRQVALSFLLQHLPTQVLDVVVEPTESPLDANLIESWEALLQSRELRGQKLKVATAVALRVNE